MQQTGPCSQSVNSEEVSVQTDDFNVGDEYQAMVANNPDDGAVVFFVGQVRKRNQGSDVSGLYLEHYPAMTQKSLENIVSEARSRWPAINRVRLVHRVGQLYINDQIVFVAVSSSHREQAFDACHFIMDFLKNRAPFWKKETLNSGEQRWVEALEKDQQALTKWD